MASLARGLLRLGRVPRTSVLLGSKQVTAPDVARPGCRLSQRGFTTGSGSGDGGRGYKGPDGDSFPLPDGSSHHGADGGSMSFPDSWVEPEALWDYAQSHPPEEVETVDDKFAMEFGQRNEAWRERMLREDPTIFENIGAGQSPKYLWIGCGDSRVAAETMVESKPGEIFVHRNIANMVVSTDTNMRAVLHFALDYLQVKHIIVCGHYDCGGVKAAVTNQDHRAPVEFWLANIRDVYRLHQEELDAIISEEERHKRLVELNVIEQCLNLFKTGDVQRRRAYTGSRPEEYDCAYPRIHGMVFAPSDGKLRMLPIDFRHYLTKYKRVYQMYDTTDFATSMDA